MKNNEKMELLTSELYQQISTSKSSKIAELKNMRGELLKQITNEENFLKELQQELIQLSENIKCSKKSLVALRNKKLKLNREMNKQRRLASKLNKLATKEDCYIDVDSFYPEEKSKTR